MDALSAEAYSRYRTELYGARLARQMRVGALVVIALWTGFILLDFAAYREQFRPLLYARLGLDASLLALLLRLRTHAPTERLLLAGVLATGFGLVAVIGIAGGVTSQYYPGIMLLFLGMPVLLPLSARQAAWVVGALFVSFAALPILGTGPVPMRDYLIHLFFPGAAALECVASCALLDRMRFQDYLRREEIVRARDELAQLDQVKTRFAANVHHELRTPLTLMLAPLEGLRSGDYGDVAAPAERALRTMHVNGRRLLKLINNLLDLAKLESQQFEIDRRPFQMSGLVDNVVEGAQPMAEQKGIALSTSGLDSLPMLFADPDALEKVVVNLLGNALKFTESGGSIEVRARALTAKEGGGLELAVADTGIGLEPDQLDRIFDRFAQVDASATRKHEGTGIGLSLAQELTELHGGKIWAESAGIGQGATMFVQIPIGEPVGGDEAAREQVLRDDSGRSVDLGQSIRAVEAEIGLENEADEPGGNFVEMEHSVERWQRAHAGGEPEGEAPTSTPGLPRVLVADDNADMRELLGFILSREFEVHVRKNGREALESIRDVAPDLLVTDIMMPEMSGTELCREVKSDPEIRDIPVMLVSSKAESEMKIEGLELGADDYVTKPFHPRELLARARSLAGLRRAQRELADRNTDLESAMQELQQAEAQLVQSERLAAVGELAAGIAHEVNNPVNYALNASRALGATAGEITRIAEAAAALDWSDREKLAEQGATLRAEIEAQGVGEMAGEIWELIQIVGDGLQRTQKLVADLRDFAAPGKSGQHARVDVRAGLRSTVELLGHDLRDRGATVQLQLPAALSSVEGDPGALNQVFLNLLKNAAEAMEGTGGSIWVDVSEEDGAVRVRVRDEGPGIAPEAQSQLFDPFFSTKEAGRGTGLGLSMCRQIAAAHDGSLELTSAPGEGACFVLSLPIETNADDAGVEPTDAR